MFKSYLLKELSFFQNHQTIFLEWGRRLVEMYDTLQLVKPLTMAIPPKLITKNIKKGRTMLKPSVLIKLINNKGKSGICFSKLDIIM